jgi:Concanavalin A-like lectin/glucanases superfamily
MSLGSAQTITTTIMSYNKFLVRALLGTVIAAGLAGPAVAATNILQYGFDATFGDVAVPVNDDSGALHHGTHLLFGAAPTYSGDIPTAGTAPGQARNVTGVGSVDFTGTAACISTANSANQTSGQGIVTAAQIAAAGGLTMEVWVKNPSSTDVVTTQGTALTLGGMHLLGEQDGRIGWINNNASTAWTTNQFVPGQWNHLAVVMKTSDPTANAYTDISSYLNGVLIHSAPHTFPWFLDRAAAVGNHQFDNWGNYEGLVYEPRITLGALTPQQFTVVEPVVSLTAPEVVEDSTNGEVLSLPVKVRNSLATAYRVTGISFAGAAAASFADGGNTFPLEIPANGTADVFVAFTPGAGSLAEATLTLATDDPGAPSLDVDFSIEVRDPEISVRSSYDFGLFLFPPGPVAREISVTNLGLTHDLVLSDPQITGAGAAAYSVTTLPGPITDTGMLEVTFTPTAAGEYPASLALTTNDPYHPTVTISLSGRLAGGATRVMQWGFDETTGPVVPPVNDDSGNTKHGTHILFGTAPTYSADIPAASFRQNTTGVGAVDFTGTNAAISTANSPGVGSGQGIITATDVYNARGYTMEVWVKNPSHITTDVPLGLALAHAGMHGLGEESGRIGWFGAGTGTAWSTNQYAPGEWNHLAVVLRTSDPTAKSFTSVSTYLNGILIHSAPHTFPFFLDRAVSVGNHQYDNWANYEGLVYEPRISLGALGVNEFTFVPGLRTMAAVNGQSDGEATSLPVTITNSSGTAYSVTGVAYSGADAAAFSGTPTLPLVIPAGGSSEMLVGFTPSHGGGTYTATLTLTTNDPNHPTMAVTLIVVVAGADANLIRVTATSLVSPTRMRIDFEGRANTAYQVKSSADLQQQIFSGAVTVAVDGLTTNDTGGGRGVGFVEFDITVPGRMFYQIQTP